MASLTQPLVKGECLLQGNIKIRKRVNPCLGIGLATEQLSRNVLNPNAKIKIKV